ncbi:MAG: ATP synthase F0 subunit B [Actinomycetota bacterium]
MLTAVVTQSGSAITVHLASVPPNSTAEQTITAETVPSDAAVATPLAATAEGSATGATVEVNPGPSPIAPELKEVAWGGGSFVVFAVLMRFVLYPRLKKGMDARYAGIRSSHEGADATRAEAKAEVAGYEAQLAGVKAEAAAHIDAARQTLETERAAKLAAVGAEIAEQRAAASAANDAARQAVQAQIESAVGDVSGRAIELAVGTKPDAAVVSRVVLEVMSAGVAR